jgi:hypothetical protein
MTLSEKIISFLMELEFKGSLPAGITVMNPFRGNPQVIRVIEQFYTKFYNDENPRHIILGINPGRFGAGVTGIPFTDTKRLAEKCGIAITGIQTFEPSSAFIYEMIDKFGGVGSFYSAFYISAVSPLGFTSQGTKGGKVNFNYYDKSELTGAVYDFIIQSMEKQMQFGINRDVCFCLGTGKNYKFILELNKKYGYFKKIVPLEHPRYIMQYKSREKDFYISKYLEELRKYL